MTNPSSTAPSPAAPLDVDAIEKRANAATPGPWWFNDSPDAWRLFAGDDEGETHPAQLAKCAKRLTPYAEYWPNIDDSMFIAAARTDIPRLCARVREMEAEAARLRATVDGERLYWSTDPDGEDSGDLYEIAERFWDNNFDAALPFVVEVTRAIRLPGGWLAVRRDDGEGSLDVSEHDTEAEARAALTPSPENGDTDADPR